MTTQTKGATMTTKKYQYSGSGEDLYSMIAEEFERLGFRTHARDINKLALALEEQDAEYGEVGIMAACVGYIAAYRS